MDGVYLSRHCESEGGRAGNKALLRFYERAIPDRWLGSALTRPIPRVSVSMSRNPPHIARCNCATGT